ncbi:MAG: hypothetical protein HUU01_18345 [Saprospiraceae bacterium]|nr:hypothetical protein [Saprospiraceae bacterium]
MNKYITNRDMQNLSFRGTGLLLGMLVLAVACGPNPEHQIVGQWQAVAVLEEGDSLEVDPQYIKLAFGKNKDYSYNGPLKYEESGSYYVESKYLYTLDTLNQASTEKAVEIVKLTEDSLQLLMKEGARERLLKFVKVR